MNSQRRIFWWDRYKAMVAVGSVLASLFCAACGYAFAIGMVKENVQIRLCALEKWTDQMDVWIERHQITTDKQMEVMLGNQANVANLTRDVARLIRVIERQ